MYHHVKKKLMYTVRVDNPDPAFGNMLLEQFGWGQRGIGCGHAIFGARAEL